MPRLAAAFALVLSLGWGLASGCARPDFNPGEPCELNNECDARLVCRLARCRIECRVQRDCPLGLQCVRDASGLGACQVESERRCATNSQCEAPLVCLFGQCTNACNDDRDCPSGAACVDDGGERACVDMSERECELNSDCLNPLFICANDHRCRVECITDRDCRDGERCRDDLEASPICAPGDPEDGGVDGGAPDGSVPDGGPADGGVSATPAWLTLAAGLEHTCATRSTGATACWGANDRAQLGDGTTVDRPTARALGIAGLRVIGAGAGHSCAATTSELFCWGGNAAGQTGTAGDPVNAPEPVLGLPTPITELALGNDHSCAIADGRLFCWGGNDQGQLGLGDASPRASPTEVPLGVAPVQVSLFGRTSCVRFTTGELACFGDGGLGQIGDGGGVDRDAPSAVIGITDALQVAAGTSFGCALLASGEVRCWGNDVLGQLGDGAAVSSSPTPVAVVGLPAGVQQIAVGSAHACARTATELYCWGDNTFAQCGLDPASGTSVRVATRVPSVTGPVDAVGVGTNHTCVRSGDAIACFGDNMRGQLGNGATSAREVTPQPVVWP